MMAMDRDAQPCPKVLLVCAGNTCRSPMAATLLAARLGGDCPVSSAGTAARAGDPAAASAVQVMAERGLDLSAHRAQPISQELVAQSDLVLTMTRSQRQMVIDLVPGAADRVFTLVEYATCPTCPPSAEGLDIPDPLGMGIDVYRTTADHLQQLVDRVADKLMGCDRT
ncbi:MAG TPA: low molecular weight protein arginine phosphatase [Clostridiales bacterium]|nr:low molecular weight protein arginine phosphatase [Clostridiales bacterium]